jgi:hypothetical protein
VWGEVFSAFASDAPNPFGWLCFFVGVAFNVADVAPSRKTGRVIPVGLLKDQLLSLFKIRTAPTYCPRCDHRNIIRGGAERGSYDPQTGEWRSYGWTFEGFDEIKEVALLRCGGLMCHELTRVEVPEGWRLSMGFRTMAFDPRTMTPYANK